MSMSFEDLDLNLSSGSFCPITSDKFIYVSSPPYSHLCTRDSDTSTMGSLYLHPPTSHSISLLKVLGYFKLISGYLKILHSPRYFSSSL